MKRTTNSMDELRQHLPVRPVTVAGGLELAEQLASLLLALTGMSPRNNDVRRMTEELGVRIAVVNTLGVPIMNECIDCQWIIAMRGGGATTQQRFALARELWYVITEGRDDLFSTTDPEKVQLWMRRCAEQFAVSLLVPAMWVYEAWARPIRDTQHLSDYFRVPTPVMERRLRQLGLHKARQVPTRARAVSCVEACA
jgi:hypothetical protein